MSEPTLFIIAGCNGSGKSSFSKSLVPAGCLPFDYDFYFLKFYASLLDSDVRDTMAHNMAFNELENQVTLAINDQAPFCYETNFNSTPLYWPTHFHRKGYKLHLIYLCLDSIGEAKKRVAIRVENGGHFVPESEITKRYFEGFENLNEHFRYFDIIDLFDTSHYMQEPSHVLSIGSGEVEMKTIFPQYLVELLPEIAKNIAASK